VKNRFERILELPRKEEDQANYENLRLDDKGSQKHDFTRIKSRMSRLKDKKASRRKDFEGMKKSYHQKVSEVRETVEQIFEREEIPLVPSSVMFREGIVSKLTLNSWKDLPEDHYNRVLDDVAKQRIKAHKRAKKLKKEQVKDIICSHTFSWMKIPEDYICRFDEARIDTFMEVDKPKVYVFPKTLFGSSVTPEEAMFAWNEKRPGEPSYPSLIKSTGGVANSTVQDTRYCVEKHRKLEEKDWTSFFSNYWKAARFCSRDPFAALLRASLRKPEGIWNIDIHPYEAEKYCVNTFGYQFADFGIEVYGQWLRCDSEAASELWQSGLSLNQFAVVVQVYAMTWDKGLPIQYYVELLKDCLQELASRNMGVSREVAPIRADEDVVNKFVNKFDKIGEIFSKTEERYAKSIASQHESEDEISNFGYSSSIAEALGYTENIDEEDNFDNNSESQISERFKIRNILSDHLDDHLDDLDTEWITSIEDIFSDPSSLVEGTITSVASEIRTFQELEYFYEKVELIRNDIESDSKKEEILKHLNLVTLNQIELLKSCKDQEDITDFPYEEIADEKDLEERNLNPLNQLAVNVDELFDHLVSTEKAKEISKKVLKNKKSKKPELLFEDEDLETRKFLEAVSKERRPKEFWVADWRELSMFKPP